MNGRPSTFWGKLQRRGDGEVVAWHPLIDHCADVAACCEALLALPVVERRLAALAGRDALDRVTRARLAVLCALHDLGKLNHGFQRKATRSAAVAGHVTEGLALLDPRGSVGFDGFEALGIERMGGWGEARGKTLVQLLTASIAHHGRPHDPTHCNVSPKLWRGGVPAPLDGLRTLADAARGWFTAAFEDGPPLPAGAAFAHAFCGLVTLADWLGSDTDAFPYTTDDEHDPSGAARMAFARERAPRVLAEVGLDTKAARAAIPARPGFDAISTYPPRAAQRAVLGLPVEAGGSIAALEAETGSGKTEAALARYVRLFAAGEVDGMYFAVPTRTAATQLHRRVTEAIERAFPDPAVRPPVSLAVPGYLRVDDAEGRKLPGFEVLWNDRDEARWRFRGWAVENSKRYLAGAVVVGTIDQVLLSGLRLDHAHLRATSLLRLLLVVDEVHASDAYMTTLLEEVLARHRRAGGHALLLSATLGGEARARLLATGSGQRARTPSLAEARVTPYPRVSYRGRSAEAIDVAGEQRSRAIDAELWPAMDDDAAIAARALEAARAGARVLVLRNTVTGCLAVQRAIEAAAGLDAEALFRCEGVAAPHHSRFAEPDRRRLDSAIERAFGKDSTASGVVAVATQTVEQSLDLDADLMLTDLCPMDVLLQRVGRLHRHERPTRPAGFERARVVVLTPAERDLAAKIDPRTGRGRAGHGLGSVYADLRVIEATWQSLEADPTLRVPEQCRARVEAAVHSEALAAVAVGERWAKHAQLVQGELFGETSAARLNRVDWSARFGTEDSLFPPKGERKVPTRLGDDDRLIDLREARPRGPFGGEVTQLKISGWLANQERIGDDPTIAVTGQDADGFDFTIDGALWRYDRHGVQVIHE